MCKKLIVLSLMLGLASISFADTVIGNWEGAMDGWAAGWDRTPIALSYSTTGATLGSNSLGVKPATVGWGWSLKQEGMYGQRALMHGAGVKLLVDVTWVTSEWDDGGVGSGAWSQVGLMFVNSNPGWWQTAPTDTVNPSYPGSWDPYNYGESHTRTLAYDLNGYNWAGVEGAWWLQIGFALNGGGFVSGGNVYFDNVRLTPEPATMGLLGLGGLALIRRKK